MKFSTLIFFKILNMVRTLVLVTATRSALYFPSKTAILGKKASGHRTAKSACVTSLVRVCQAKMASSSSGKRA